MMFKDRGRLLAGVGLLSIFTSSFVYMLGVHMLRPIMALYFDSVGYAAVMIGLFASLNAFIPIMFGMPIGSWIDRMGTRRAVVIGCLLGLLSGVTFMVGSSQGMILLVLLGQVINGVSGMFAWGALQVAASLAANQQHNPNKSNHVISNFSFVNSMGQLAGPAVGGVVSDWGSFQLVFYLFVGLNLLGLVLSMALPAGSYASRMDKLLAQEPVQGEAALESKQKSKPSSESGQVKKEPLWKSYGTGYAMMRTNKPFAVAILLNGILFMLIDVRTTFFPLFLVNKGLTHTEIGSMLSVAALAALIVRPLAGYLMNRLGYHKIMMISIFSGAGCLLALLLNTGYGLLAANVFIWGVCTSVNQPVALMMVSQTVKPSERGLGMSIRTMSNRIVQLTNPLLFGMMTTVIGLTGGFGVMGVLLLGFGVLYHRQSKAKS
ncbi:MFS transporter [Paenibacillus sp. FSL H8-0034]|uniref:MFS transporter n=1 Tax=Paenibacillus sp. FSL H8-0034 TaxID=2954671 RepID=UPI0030F6E146